MWIEEALRRRQGCVPFDEMMELALYDPEHGYYSSGQVRYGRRGDFITAPTVSGWYAATLARFAGDLARRTTALEVVDVASGDGSFLAAFLGALPEDASGRISRIVSVERSEVRRRRQAERFGGHSRIGIVADLGEAPPPAGPVFVHASELYDAFPVRRAVMRAAGLMELWVKLSGEGLAWEERPAREETVSYLASHGVKLEEGQIAEVNLTAETFHRSLLRWAADDALVFVLDYGYPATRLYDPRGRRNGSLACYREHRLSRDPLEAPGEQDITAHVNWDDLRRAAAGLGWSEIGLWPLAELLVRAGLGGLIEERGLGIETDLDAGVYAERQEIKRLLDPEGMGSDLKALIQGRGPLGEAARDLLRVGR